MPGKLAKLNPAELTADIAAFAKLEPVLHQKGRLQIVSVLAANEALSFTELRDALRLTDGNLAAHLTALQEMGYVQTVKRGTTGKPLTFVALTASGRAAFRRYLDGLEYIVQRHR